jgi:hypothetical protein
MDSRWKGVVDYVGAIRNENLWAHVSGDAIDAKQGMLKEYMGALSVLTGRAIRTKQDLYRAQSVLEQPGLRRSAQALIAKAEKAREGNIPDFLLEKDVPTLVSRWVDGVSRAALLRKPLMELESNIKLLQKAGDLHTAEKMQNLVDDLKTGTDRFSRAAGELIDRYKVQMNRMGAPAVFAALPDVISYAGREMYNNLLGWRVKPLIRNLTQPLGTTATEISNVLGGESYGAIKVWQGYLDTIKNAGKNTELLESLRYLPKGHIAEAATLKLPGEAGYSKARLDQFFRAVSSINAIGLKGMALTDNINRAVTYHAAKGVAADYFNNATPRAQEAAKRFASRLGEAWKVEIKKLQNAGKLNEETLTKVFAAHLIDRTQFRYNRMLAGQLTRQLGPVLMAFSKWPTSVAGDIVDKVRQYGWQGGLQVNALKWAAPWFALQGIDKMRDYDYDDLSERQKGLLYKEGLSAFAPASSVTPAAIGSVTTSPFVQLLTSAKDSFEQGGNIEDWQLEMFQQFATKAFNTYAPGAGMYNIYTTEFPRLVLNEEKKPLFFEED